MTTYRPQFVYPPTPAGFEDEQFHYSYDGTNCPLLNSANPIPAGGLSSNIILLTQADAPFFARGLNIQLGTSDTNLWFQLKTPRGDYMQKVPVPIVLYAGMVGGLPVAGQVFVAFESEIECPPGSSWTLYLYNPTSGNVNPPEITLFGVKRRKVTA